MKTLPLLGSVLVFLLLFSGTTVNAQFSIDTTVGLDGPTRELIAGLPAALQQVILGALQGGLHLLDESAESYLNKMNDILGHQINHAQCSTTGIMAEAKRRLQLPLTREKGPLELHDLYDQNEVARLKESSRADLFAQVYGDSFFDASVTFCEMQFSASSVNAGKREDADRQLNFMWLRLEDICGQSDVSGCLKKEHEHALSLADRSDPRDVGPVNALVKINEVPESVSKASLFASFDPGPYNSALLSLIRVEDEITVAKAAREQRAVDATASARSVMQRIDAALTTADGILSPQPDSLCLYSVSPAQIDAARPYADSIDQLLPQVDAALTSAQSLDNVNRTSAIAELRTSLSYERTGLKAIRDTHSHIGPDKVPNCVPTFSPRGS